MKYISPVLLCSLLLPLGTANAQERPQYTGQSIQATASPVFITPTHRRHVVGAPPRDVAPNSSSYPDASLVLASPLQSDTLAAGLGPFVKYCDQGRNMSDDDWRTIERAGGRIPDALRDDCLPPK